RNAHYTFDDAVADFPLEAINDRPPNVPYTPWHIVEHLRIAQWDILEFMRDPAHTSPEWPKGYWPDPEAATDAAGWSNSLDAFRGDLAAVQEMVRDGSLELTVEIPHAPGYTYLREFLLVADHNAYHVGEFAILRQVMGTWPSS
ncbi:MAG: DinB family protein, partial [Chloroflexota bacterium]